MRVLIQGGSVVTGDGQTVIENGTVVVEDGRIAGIERRWDDGAPVEGEILDATGCVVMPGTINCHTHGVAPGPVFPSGAPAPPDEVWLASLDRHLLAGTTTVLSTCGFVTMEQIAAADRAHPVNVKGSTSHTPGSLRAALEADGAGIDRHTANLTVTDMLEAGAVAIGELGAGHTLGGGGQDVLYIPRAIERATGVRVDSHQARRIKEAALGRHIRTDEFDAAAMTRALAAAGLDGKLTPDAARKLIARCVMPSFLPAIESFREGAELSAQLGVPALMHSAAPTLDVMREVTERFVPRGARIVACHSNHPSFTPEEARTLAVDLAAAGCTIEVCTLDLLIGRRIVDTREEWDVLFDVPGLVDVIATDYGFEGCADPILAGVADAVARGCMTLPEAVALGTSHVAAAIPGIAPQRGLLAPGLVADVAIARAEDLTDVRDVLVAGRRVVRDGALAYPAPVGGAARS